MKPSVSLVALVAAAAALAKFLQGRAQGQGANCRLPRWPADREVQQWQHQGAREKCFCAYASHDPSSDEARDLLTRSCPLWPEWVSSNHGMSANLISHTPRSTILGNDVDGSILDWAVDLGNGFNQRCTTQQKGLCMPIGHHILSIPRNQFLLDCCSSGKPSLVDLAKTDAVELCLTLRDMIAGALKYVTDLERYHSCERVGEEPTDSNTCLAQCFHIRPDVQFAHLHTTAGVVSVRSGPVNSGLGPSYNASESSLASAAYGKYNACVCEPEEWGEESSGRGTCPQVKPIDSRYAFQAAYSLCRNLIGVVGGDPRICITCRKSAIMNRE